MVIQKRANIAYAALLLLTAVLATYGYKNDQIFEAAGVVTVGYFLLAMLGQPVVRLFDDYGHYLQISSSFLSGIFGLALTYAIYGLQYIFR